MRISVDCRSLCEPYPSGVSHYTRELLRAMLALPASQAHEWILFVNGFQFRNGRQRERLIKIAGFPQTPNITWRFTKIPSKLFTVAAIIAPFFSPRTIVGDGDVLFLSNIDFFPFRSQRIPIALTVHDCSFALYPELFPLKDRVRYRLLRPYFFMKKCPSLIAVSEHTRSDLQRAEVVATIYPGNDHRIPEHDDEVFCAELPAQYILILGNVEPRKNVQAALAAFQALRRVSPFADMKLVLVGAMKRHAAIARALRRDSAVHWYGYLSEEQKWTLIRHARVLFYPSLYEGFGFPPLEAQRVGTPVIVGAHSSFPEVIGHSGIMVDVTDVQAIKRALVAVCGDETLRKELRTRGDENWQRFRWQRSAEQTLDVLTALRYNTI